MQNIQFIILFLLQGGILLYMGCLGKRFKEIVAKQKGEKKKIEEMVSTLDDKFLLKVADLSSRIKEEMKEEMREEMREEIKKEMEESIRLQNKQNFREILFLQNRIWDIDIQPQEFFEEYLATIFGYLGYRVILPDKEKNLGVDLRLERRGEQWLVRAEKSNSYIGAIAVQEVVKAKEQYQISQSLFITNSYFTDSAISLANDHKIELIDREGLIQMFTKEDVKLLEKENAAFKKMAGNNTCPLCKEGAIVKREGPYGSFYGCSRYPKCDYKRKSRMEKNEKILLSDPQPSLQKEEMVRLVLCDVLYVIEASYICKNCESETKVIGFGVEKFYEVNQKASKHCNGDIYIVPALEPMPAELLQYIQEKYNFRETYLQNNENPLYGNYCDHCEAIQSVAYLFEDTAGPFWTNEVEKVSELTLYQILLDYDIMVNVVELAGTCKLKKDGLRIIETGVRL